MMRLLGQEELSVAELQEILEMGQSRISSHLDLLRRNGLVADRKDGKRILCFAGGFLSSVELIVWQYRVIQMRMESDQSALTSCRSRAEVEKYFDEVAERLGKNYVQEEPGSDWPFSFRSPPITIVDLGQGGNDFPVLAGGQSNLCGQFQKYGSFGNRLGQRKGLANLEYKLGDIEKVPYPQKAWTSP